MSSIDSANDSVSTIQQPEEIQQEYTGTCCEKCEEPISCVEPMICRRCGWYAGLGTYVEIDRSWEAASDPEMAEEQPATEKTSLPEWLWILTGCLLLIILESVAVRLMTPAESSLRTTWSLTQLFSGTACFVVCHVCVFVILLNEDASTNLLDVILRPIRIWSYIFSDLPQRQWMVHLGFSGLLAALMSLLVIGAIPYERLLDWGTTPPPKQNLMGAIMDQAQKAKGDDNKSLEEAVQDLGGSADLEDSDNKEKKPSNEPKPRGFEDCLILGYKANHEGLVYSLILGAERFNKLQYVGRVTVQLPLKELREISNQLAETETSRPFVPMQLEATWVKPKFFCRVSYARKGKKGGLYEVELEEWLGAYDLPEEVLNRQP